MPLPNLTPRRPATGLVTLTLTQDEANYLYHTLAEEAARMDDDGREGYFDSTPLRPVYDKLRAIFAS